MKPHLPIAQWPSAVRPRERLQSKGAAAMSDAELIAILISTGTDTVDALALASNILKIVGGLGKLGKMSMEALTKIDGIGIAKAARLLAACEIGRRRELPDDQNGAIIRTAGDAAAWLATEIRDRQQECFAVMFLDTKHRMIGKKILNSGTTEEVFVNPREVLKVVIENNSSAFVVAHNHPSGDPAPSSADIALTRRLAAAATIIGVRMLDHVIIGNGVFISLAEKGYCCTEKG